MLCSHTLQSYMLRKSLPAGELRCLPTSPQRSCTSSFRQRPPAGCDAGCRAYSMYNRQLAEEEASKSGGSGGGVLGWACMHAVCRVVMSCQLYYPCDSFPLSQRTCRRQDAERPCCPTAQGELWSILTWRNQQQISTACWRCLLLDCRTRSVGRRDITRGDNSNLSA